MHELIISASNISMNKLHKLIRVSRWVEVSERESQGRRMKFIRAPWGLMRFDHCSCASCDSGAATIVHLVRLHANCIAFKFSWRNFNFICFNVLKEKIVNLILISAHELSKYRYCALVLVQTNWLSEEMRLEHWILTLKTYLPFEKYYWSAKVEFRVRRNCSTNISLCKNLKKTCVIHRGKVESKCRGCAIIHQLLISD